MKRLAAASMLIFGLFIGSVYARQDEQPKKKTHKPESQQEAPKGSRKPSTEPNGRAEMGPDDPGNDGHKNYNPPSPPPRPPSSAKPDQPNSGEPNAKPNTQ